MELNKRKFKKGEVEEIISSIKADFENKLGELKDRNIQLIAENNKLNSELEYFKLQQENIAKTLKNAQKNADSVVKEAQKQYLLEIETLKNFSQKWQNYFLALKEKYPLYPTVVKACELKEKIDAILDKKTSKEAIDSADKQMDSLQVVPTIKNNKKIFSPSEKIQEHICATSDNGFSLDDVLNPGELQLEDLCKELGLMEEENL